MSIEATLEASLSIGNSITEVVRHLLKVFIISAMVRKTRSSIASGFPLQAYALKSTTFHSTKDKTSFVRHRSFGEPPFRDEKWVLSITDLNPELRVGVMLVTVRIN